MTTNRSFWQDEVGIPGIIRDSPIPSSIADDEILVKVHAWAMNPADHILQDTPLPFIKYPLVLGEDVAGSVTVVGSTAASKFNVGDRILAYAVGIRQPERGAFQEYVVVPQELACKIPESMSYIDASVFPLCITTAAHGLFSKEFLGLPFPKVDPVSTGKGVVIWGGSSGVGSNGIQLAKAAGFEVLTTCSARNFDFVKSLGADKVFDYKSPTAVDEIVNEIDKGTCVGIFHAAGQINPSCQVSHRSKQKLFVASTNPVTEGAAPEGVEAKFLLDSSGGSLFWRETNAATFGGFFPEALAKGRYRVAPAAEVVPTKGLDGIQEALDMLRKGVSAKKIVVEAN